MDREIKLIFRDDSFAEKVFMLLSGNCTIAGLHSTNSENITINDEYFDIHGLELEKRNIILRKRCDNAGERFELKWRTKYA